MEKTFSVSQTMSKLAQFVLEHAALLHLLKEVEDSCLLPNSL